LAAAKTASEKGNGERVPKLEVNMSYVFRDLDHIKNKVDEMSKTLSQNVVHKSDTDWFRNLHNTCHLESLEQRKSWLSVVDLCFKIIAIVGGSGAIGLLFKSLVQG